MSKKVLPGDVITIFGARYKVKKKFTVPSQYTDWFFKLLLDDKYIVPHNG